MHLSSIPLAIFGCAAVVTAECTADAFTEILKDHPEATVNLVEAVPQNGSFGQPETDIPFPFNATELPALCAVSINVKSSENSSYNFGIFLPDTTWNERFLATGNGGFGGGINWPDMGRLSQYGFATMSTDTGHSGDIGDGSFGLNPESLIDWSYRALHGSIVLAKEVITSYYASEDGIKYSYYAGCSTGGRQGLKEIQLYPDSFDGISVGAPAWWTVRLAANTLQQGLYNVPEDDPKHIDPSLFPAVVAEMEKQCDPQDGLVDGIISDPFGCNFNFEALLCTPDSDPTACLTPAQLTTIYKFYNPWVDTNQTYLFPGASIGADPTFTLSNVSPLGYGLFQYWVYNTSEWDYTKFSFNDVLLADSINPGGATADNFDLSPFRERGGKILKYHGDTDPLIHTGSSIHFYKQVFQTLAPKGIDLDDFYRFFLVPGMDHCSGSRVAPWYFGSASQSIRGTTHSVPGFESAEYDIILSMMKWVEEGEAPEKLIATKFVNDTATLGVQSQRPLCPYPLQAKYVEGDVNKPESWECKSLY